MLINIKEKYLSTSLDLPTTGPFMQGEEIAYESGDKLNLNCSSAKSFPASHLQFYINDDPVSLIN